MTVHSYTSPLLQVPHAFFTREGGVSKGIYASLNCGNGSRDAASDVRENRRRAASGLGFSADHLCTLYQVHSPNVVTLSTPIAPGQVQADALVTQTPGLLLGILTADCAPVLFADAQAGVVGAAHAGWKGAFTGVLENTIAAMADLGAREIHAAIGPCISQESYEVGAEFLARFLEDSPENAAFFSPSGREGHAQFDLPGYVAHRLARAGLRHIGRIAKDTCAEEQAFFSYRRTTLRGEGDYGRQLSAIGLKGIT